ncbi:MAG: hypothetical protein ACYDIB_07345 [Desulfobulbia bacterium]
MGPAKKITDHRRVIANVLRATSAPSDVCELIFDNFDRACRLARIEVDADAVDKEQKASDRHGNKVIGLIFEELRLAEAKHPGWPEDQIHAAAILAEEVGEVVKAAIDHEWAGGSIDEIRKEAAQVGAMALRLLLHLPEEKNLDGSGAA